LRPITELGNPKHWSLLINVQCSDLQIAHARFRNCEAHFANEVSTHKAGPVYSRLVNSCTGPERIYSAMDIFYVQQYITIVYSIYFNFSNV